MQSPTFITIATTEGGRQVEAELFGAWAVHRPWNGKGWSITHVASGKCIPPFYTEDLSKPTAVRCAQALDEHFPNPSRGDRETGKRMAELIWRVSLGGGRA